jgi:hypothetical protein
VVETADDVIERLKSRLHAATDQGLAEKLSVGRSTITSWRRRGSVPPRYARIADLGQSADLGRMAEWSKEERAALNLALFRLTKGYAAQIVDYPTFLMKVGFLGKQLVGQMDRALLDLNAEMDARGLDDAEQCVNLMVYESFNPTK